MCSAFSFNVWIGLCSSSKCGSFPPESCLFSLIGNVGAFMGTSSQNFIKWINKCFLFHGSADVNYTLEKKTFFLEYFSFFFLFSCFKMNHLKMSVMTRLQCSLSCENVSVSDAVK